MDKIAYPPVWQRIPNTSFGVGMGLAGQAILWNVAVTSNEFLSENIQPQFVGFGFWIASLTVTVVFLVLFVAKAVNHWPLVKEELLDGSRIHFINMPHLILIMLTISVPQTEPLNLVVDESQSIGREICFAIGLASQLVATSFIYETWLFSDNRNISCAKPQFLLSTVGWFLLAVLGATLDIEQRWGVSAPSFCLGIGLVFYLLVTISVFNGLHLTPNVKGSPGLFLLIAPPSVGAVAWDLIENGSVAAVDDSPSFAFGAKLLLGWCLGVVLLLFRLGPQISKRPPVLGAYWAYVFPLASLAVAWVRYAAVSQTASAQVLGIIWIIVSVVALCIVFCRECYHFLLAIRGKAMWGDPLMSKEKLATGLTRYNNLRTLDEDDSNITA